MSTKDWAEKDYYKILGVSKDAKPEEIKKAFRKIARDNHPDSHPGDKAAEARFKEASEANDVLSNAKKRKEYDQARSLFGSAGGFRFPRGGAQTSVNVEDFLRTASNGDGFGDLFGNLFGASGGRRTASRSPRRGADVEGRRRFPSTMPCLGPPSLWTWSLRHPARHVGGLELGLVPFRECARPVKGRVCMLARLVGCSR